MILGALFGFQFDCHDNNCMYEQDNSAAHAMVFKWQDRHATGPKRRGVVLKLDTKAEIYAKSQ